MARTKEEIISEMVDSGLFSDTEIKDAASEIQAVPTTQGKPEAGFFKSYENGPKTLPQKADVMVGKATSAVLGTGMDIVNAPFDVVGETARRAIEANNPGPYRMPSIVQRFFPSTQTPEPPPNPLSLVNKLLRAGTAAITGIPSGTGLESARTAYNAPRGLPGAVEDTALGLLLGKVAPEVLTAPVDAAVAGITKTAGAAKNAASNLVKKGIRVGFGPTEEAQSVLFNRPQDVARQTDFADLGDKLAKVTNELKGKIGDLDKSAWETLRTSYSPVEGAMPKTAAMGLIKKAKSDLKVFGGGAVGNASKQAVKALDAISEDIQGVGQNVRGMMKEPGATPTLLDINGQEILRTTAIDKNTHLPEQSIKGIIQSLDENINWDSPEMKPINTVLEKLRTLFDKKLKSGNEGYKDAMVPVAKATSALNEVSSKFRLEKRIGQGFLPTKSTVDALQRSTKGKSPELDRVIQQIKDTTGVDFADEAKLTAIKQQFDSGMRANGSRRAVAGGAIGGAVGTMIAKALNLPAAMGASVGGAAGVGIGTTADYYGGPMARDVINSLSRGKTGVGNVLSAINSKTQGTPLQNILQRILEEQPAFAPILKRRQ